MFVELVDTYTIPYPISSVPRAVEFFLSSRRSRHSTAAHTAVVFTQTIAACTRVLLILFGSKDCLTKSSLQHL